MEAYKSHCSSCGATYTWTGYKTGLGKTEAQLERMRQQRTVCKRCGAVGLQTGLDHESEFGQASDTMAQMAVSAILGLLGEPLTQPAGERQLPYPDPANVPVPRLEDSPPFDPCCVRPKFERPCDEICPSCESDSVKLTVVEHMFEYGDEHAGDKVILLKATVPVFTCGKCNSSWLNECGAALKDYAVYQHLENLKRRK